MPLTLPQHILTAAHGALTLPESHKWEVQGFGMLRTYLDEAQVFRLHIWSMVLQAHEVSTIHDHPWNFTSHVLSGQVNNRRYVPTQDLTRSCLVTREFQLKCGADAHTIGESRLSLLEPQPWENIKAGESYSQLAEEVHESFPFCGTVTVIQRTFTKPRDYARVFIKPGYSFVSAAPRPASAQEVANTLALIQTKLAA